LDGDHYKSTTFPAFTITFATTITTNIGRSTCYRTVDEENGNKTFFCSVQTIITTSTN
jgi:hypothetical protein